MTKFWHDALERITWTALAVGAAYGGTYVTKLPVAWIPIGTIILTLVKTLVAGRIGDKSSAAIPLTKETTA